MKTRNRLNLERLEVRDCPAADLIVENVTLKFAGDIVVPGDPGFVRYTVRNVGDEKSNPSGNLTGMHVWLSSSGDPADKDLFVGAVRNKTLRLNPGGSATFTALIEMPELDLASPVLAEGSYYVLVEADSGFQIPEDNKFNNITASTDSVNYKFWFGDVGNRKGVALDASSFGALEIGLHGGGLGKVLLNGGFVDLSYEGTTSKSVGVITGDAGLNLRNVAATSVMNSVSLAANVTGTMNFSGGLGGLAVRDLGGPTGTATVNIGNGFTKPAVLAFNRVENASIDVDSGVKLFLARQWKDTSAPTDVLTAPFLKQMSINPLKTGLAPDFEADVTISGTPYDAKGHVVGQVKVGGTLRDSIWTVNGGPDVKILSINPTQALNFRLDTTGHVEEIEIPTNYSNSNLAQDALLARSFDNIIVKKDVSIGAVVATGVFKNDVAIRNLAVGKVITLPLSANQGGIAGITAKDWPARSAISAKWIGEIALKGNDLSDFLTTYVFNSDLSVSGVNPKTGLSIAKVSMGSGKIGGTSAVDRALWDVYGDIGTILAYKTSHWTLFGLNVGSAPGTHIKKIAVRTDMENTYLAFALGANTIEAGGFLDSTISSPDGFFGTIKQTSKSSGFTSTITAAVIDQLTVRDVGGKGSAFGIRAKAIGIYRRFDGVASFFVNPPNTVKDLDVIGTYDVVGNYSVQIVP